MVSLIETSDSILFINVFHAQVIVCVMLEAYIQRINEASSSNE